jgi:hypothetical protein
VATCIAMPVGQSTGYSYVAPRPRCATEPGRSARSAAVVSGEHDTRREETSHPGGRSPSRRPFGALPWRAAKGCAGTPHALREVHIAEIWHKTSISVLIQRVTSSRAFSTPTLQPHLFHKMEPPMGNLPCLRRGEQLNVRDVLLGGLCRTP